MQPRVSICMPSFNQAQFLPRALDRAMAQTMRDFEIIIVDDGSTDGSLEISGEYATRHDGAITILTHDNHENRGISVSTNLALDHARGEYVVILDSDDVWYVDTLERRLRFMEAQADIALMCSHYDIIDAHEIILTRNAAPDISADCRAPEALAHRMVMGCVIGNPTVMVRREAADKTGRFDPGLLHGDWEFWTRLVSRFRAGFLAESTAMHRRHDHNVTGHHTMDEEFRRRLAVMLALRRKAPGAPGFLGKPRLRALIELELCGHYFCLCRRKEAEECFLLALRTDPSLLAEGRKYFAAWLNERPIVEQPRQEFRAWIGMLLQQHESTVLTRLGS